MSDRQRDFLGAVARARRLRRQPTPAETQLWRVLRRIDGCHFRRQASIGHYVFDFAELSRRLLIEVDGGIHDLDAVRERDMAKDAWAESQGFVVLRIPNQSVFGTGEPAMMHIMAALARPVDQRGGNAC